jgi:hypothetical protein
MTGAESIVPGAAMLIILLMAYFIPTVVANGRRHHNTMAIFVLNLFLGWTFIGWLAALVWACTSVQARA